MKKFLCLAFWVMGNLSLWGQGNSTDVIDREQQRSEGGFFKKQGAILQGGGETEEEQDAFKDFGIIRKATPPRYFTFANDFGAEWDSNARLTRLNAQDSTIISERVSLKYSREFLPQWRVNSTARQQFFWFPSIPSLDFLGQALDSDVSYQIKGVFPKFYELVLDPRMFLGCNLYRYEDYNTGGQIVRTATVRGGTDHVLSMFNGKSALFYGYAGSLECSTPGVYDKHQHQVYGGWNQTLVARHLSIQGFYRFAFADYLSVNRQDKNNLLGLTLTYRVMEGVNLSGFLNYTRNDSNLADYQNLSTGILINYSYRF